MLRFRRERIRILREAVRESLYTFGKRFGVPPQSVQMWEVGKNQPRLKILMRICDGMNVPIQYFFTTKKKR
jgi:transcriptional regulator with XRE-family HTH domain